MSRIIQVNKIKIFKDPKKEIDFNTSQIINLIKKGSIKKILIIKWGGMGDVIQSTAVINDILNAFTDAEVDLNTSPLMNIFFANEKRLNKIWGFKFLKGFKNISSCYKWIKKVKSENYDLIIDLQTNDRSRILLSFLRVMFFYPKFCVGNHFVFPYSIKSKNSYSLSQPFFRLQRTIEMIGIRSKSNFPMIKIPKDSNKKIHNLLKSYGVNKDFIIFIPGSSKGNKLKRWGVENFTELAELYIRKKFQIILVGGPDDITDCIKIKKNKKNIHNFCNLVNLVNLIPLYEKAKIIIANDTGPTHLAACTTTPIIQITGPTDPYKVKPFGEKILSIQSDIDCKNCYKKTCSHHSCMLGIKPEYIYKISLNYL